MDHLTRLIDVTAGLPTPFLACDATTLAANIDRMQTMCDDSGTALRPHIKTHKASSIARMQLDAGAVGVTCATLGEAVALGEAGCSTDVFVSTPVLVDDAKRRLVERAADLHDRLTLTADSEPVARSVLDETEVPVMIEVESGLRRTGAEPDEAARLARMTGSRLAGFSTHGGHGYVPGEAAAAGHDERDALHRAAQSYASRVGVVSAGSTPTAPHAIGEPVTELRPGTYVLGDLQQVLLGSAAPADVAAAVVASVIHVSSDRFVIDAGAKALTKDRASWIPTHGRVVGLPSAVIDRLNDNHGMVTSDAQPSVGARVVVVPNHICPVVNLFDEIQLAGPERTTAIDVDLRGRLA